MARYILTLGFGGHDKERMHALAARNQDDALTPAEKEELLAYAKAGLCFPSSSPRPAARSASNRRSVASS